MTPEEKYIKALNDLHEAKKSLDELTERQKMQVLKAVFGAEVLNRFIVVMQQNRFLY